MSPKINRIPEFISLYERANWNTGKEAAEALGVKPSLISMVLNSKANPSRFLVDRLSKIVQDHSNGTEPAARNQNEDILEITQLLAQLNPEQRKSIAQMIKAMTINKG